MNNLIDLQALQRDGSRVYIPIGAMSECNVLLVTCGHTRPKILPHSDSIVTFTFSCEF